MSRQVLQLMFQAIAVWRPSHSSVGTATRVLVGPPPCKRGDLAFDLWDPLSVLHVEYVQGGRRSVYFVDL